MPVFLRSLTFGIEIEAIGQPWKIRDGWTPPQYYERLQMAMQNRGLRASIARETIVRYDEWLITTDASLRPEAQQVALEAISPKLSLDEDFEPQIKIFWDCMKLVFRVLPSRYAGTHVHVGSSGREFDLSDVKKIAFAACIYEPYVFSLLPEERRQSVYCRRNSLQADRMGELLKDHTSIALRLISEDIKGCDFSSLIIYMQGAQADGKRRRVIWNFLNLIQSPTSERSPIHTIEFRGGRPVRGYVRTLAWLSFAVTFIAMALHENLVNSEEIYTVSRNSKAENVAQFWKKIRYYARSLDLEKHLPPSFKMMSEKESWPRELASF